jgi:hypothetical protein
MLKIPPRIIQIIAVAIRMTNALIDRKSNIPFCYPNHGHSEDQEKYEGV